MFWVADNGSSHRGQRAVNRFSVAQGADLPRSSPDCLAFERRYEQTAEPFEWKLTRSDLTKSSNVSSTKPDY